MPGKTRADRTFWFVMENGRPIIEDPKSWALIESLKPGQWYAATIKSDRSNGKLGHWWAGLGWMIDRWQHTGDPRGKLFTTQRKLHNRVLTLLGYVEPLYDEDGNTLQLLPDSVAFEAMNEAEFLEMFEKARVLAFDKWGIDPWEEWRLEQQAKKDAEK